MRQSMLKEGFLSGNQPGLPQLQRCRTGLGWFGQL